MLKSGKKSMKINLASGKMYLNDYMNIDNLSMYDGKFDLKADIFSLEWEKDSVDEILLCHFMMYVDTFEAHILFQRWFKWLKSGGQLVIETGDLMKICRTILSATDDEIINGTNGVMQLFGWANTKGHKWAWCEKTLVPILKVCGFDIVRVFDGGLHNRPERDFTIIAKKP